MSRIAFILLILVNQLTSIAYGSVNVFLGNPFCQRIIQQDLTNAVRKVCSAVSFNDPFESTNTKLNELEIKIDDSLAKLWYIQTIIGRNARLCPNGYDYYPQENLCYKFYSDCKSWSEANQFCQGDNAILISLTENSLSYFRNVSRQKAGACNNVWVGTTDNGSEGKWNWLNGMQITSAFWAPGQPDNWADNENCGDLVKISDYLLNDDNCSMTNHFICQKL